MHHIVINHSILTYHEYGNPFKCTWIVSMLIKYCVTNSIRNKHLLPANICDFLNISAMSDASLTPDAVMSHLMQRQVHASSQRSFYRCRML